MEVGKNSAVFNYGANADGITDSKLLNFSWAKTNWDKEVIWLIGWFVWFTWDRCGFRGLNKINGREMFGFMTFKYKEARNQESLSAIPGLE